MRLSSWSWFGGFDYEVPDVPMWSYTRVPVRRGIRRKRLLYRRSKA